MQTHSALTSNETAIISKIVVLLAYSVTPINTIKIVVIYLKVIKRKKFFFHGNPSATSRSATGAVVFQDEPLGVLQNLDSI